MHRIRILRRSYVWLPAMMLVAVLSSMLSGPAFADFDSAVSAYNRGDYQEAQREFRSLAAAGDWRARHYLDRIREKLDGTSQTDRSLKSALKESFISIFENSSAAGGNQSDIEEETRGGSRSPTTGLPRAPESSEEPAGWQAWNSLQLNSAPVLESEIERPSRESVWSTVFHLPGDATVVGMQYLAEFFSVENLLRELQFISRHSDKITLSILAGFWWLVILRAMIGFVALVGRFSRVMATSTEHKRYG